MSWVPRVSRSYRPRWPRAIGLILARRDEHWESASDSGGWWWMLIAGSPDGGLPTGHREEPDKSAEISDWVSRSGAAEWCPPLGGRGRFGKRQAAGGRRQAAGGERSGCSIGASSVASSRWTADRLRRSDAGLPLALPAPRSAFAMKTSRLRVTMMEVEPTVVRILDVPASVLLPSCTTFCRLPSAGRTRTCISSWRTATATGCRGWTGPKTSATSRT